MNLKVLALLATLSISAVLMYNDDKRFNRNRLNKQYKIIKRDDMCADYINLVAETPTHFLSWVFSSVLVIFFILLYMFGKPFNTSNRELGLFITLFLLTNLVTYRLLNHFQWHYVRDTGRSTKLLWGI